MGDKMSDIVNKDLLENNEIYKEVYYSQNKVGDNNAA